MRGQGFVPAGIAAEREDHQVIPLLRRNEKFRQLFLGHGDGVLAMRVGAWDLDDLIFHGIFDVQGGPERIAFDSIQRDRVIAGFVPDIGPVDQVCMPLNSP